MINDNKILGVGLFLTFLAFFGLSYIYTAHYGIPYGMSDIDRYLCMLGKPNIVENCPSVTTKNFLTHVYVFILLSGLEAQEINYVINLFVWLLLPICYYIFSRDFLENKNNAVHSTLYYMYGTYAYFFFGVMLLLAQLTSFLFFLLSLAFFQQNKIKYAIFLGFLSFIGHPYIILIYCLLLFAKAWNDKNTKFIIISILCFVFFYSFLGHTINQYLVFFNSTPQASLYDVFFIFTNPLLTFFFFVGLHIKKNDTMHKFTILLLLITPFTTYTRALPFLHIMMANYGFIGLKHTMKNTKKGRYIELVFLISMFLHFTGMFNYFVKNMISEMYLRGLDPIYFKSMIGFS